MKDSTLDTVASVRLQRNKPESREVFQGHLGPITVKTLIRDVKTQCNDSGETLGEHLAGVAKNDCVIVFALRRRIAVIKAIMDVLVSTGANIVYINDEGAEQRYDVSWHFRCQSLSSGPLFNHVSVMALCHQMITRAIVLAAVDGRTRLRRIESLNERFKEL